MDPFRNRQRNQTFNNNDPNNTDQQEEKFTSDSLINNDLLSDRVSQTLSAQYIMQQGLIGRLQNEQRQQRQGVVQQHLLERIREDERQNQLMQLLQSRQREAQLRQLQEERLLLLQQQQLQPSRLSLPNVSAASAAVSSPSRNELLPSSLLGLSIQQRRRQQQQQQLLLQQEQLHQLQRLLQEQQDQRIRDQQRVADELQQVAQLDPLSLGNVRHSDMASRVAALPIRRNVNSATNIAAADFSSGDFTRVGAGLHNINASHFASLEPETSLTKPSAADATMLYPWSETSAELLQHMQSTESKSGKATAKKKSSLRKKVVGMPKRPLHAYNIFFQEERKRVLSEIPSPPEAKGGNLYVQSGKRKRRRRATHGKISFASLAKGIGEKWQGMTESEKVHYQQLAEQDLKRYHDEMEAYNAKLKDGNEKMGSVIKETNQLQGKGDDADDSMDYDDGDDEESDEGVESSSSEEK